MPKSPEAPSDLPHVVVVGGGFAGLYLTKSLRKAPIRVTLIDKCNYHLFQPLLYQVATGGVSPGDISAPLRAVVGRQKNARVILGEMEGLDLQAKAVILHDDRIGYDTLVVATGMRTGYFGHPEWQDQAPGMKTLEDALQIRRRILGAFEEAEREPDPQRRRVLTRFVVVGGGPTGVELAGALAELTRNTLAGDFRRVSPDDAEIYLVEPHPHLLPPFEPKLGERAKQDLERLGVQVVLGAHVSAVRRDHLVISDEAGDTPLEARTVIWAAGVEATPLGRIVAEATGAETDRAGRVRVNPDFSVADRDDVFVIGDLASLEDSKGQRVPGLAPAAMQAGRYLARAIEDRLAGETVEPFQYHDKGIMAVIGRNAAVAQAGRIRLRGRIAWWMWLLIHITFLIQFESKLKVLIQWAWNYITWKKGARLITYGRPSLHGLPRPSSDDDAARRLEDDASRQNPADPDPPPTVGDHLDAQPSGESRDLASRSTS